MLSDKLLEAKHFFKWLAIHKTGYRSITPAWLETFSYKVKLDVYTDLQSVSEKDINAIAAFSAESLVEKRSLASALFLFSSGIRVRAFVTLPIKAVNLEDLEIYQWTKLGVETKNRKSATTFLIKLDAAWGPIKEWDEFVRSKLPPEASWFAHISPRTQKLDTEKPAIGKNRSRIVDRDLKNLTRKNDFQTDFTPHDFRRGHANFLFDRAMDMADLIAAQNNLMHKSLTTTEIYARQRQEQTRKRIFTMSQRDTSIQSTVDPSSQILLEKMIEIQQMLKKER